MEEGRGKSEDGSLKSEEGRWKSEDGMTGKTEDGSPKKSCRAALIFVARRHPPLIQAAAQRYQKTRIKYTTKALRT
jgi:hypothetical protein